MKFEVGKYYKRRDGKKALYMGNNTLAGEDCARVFACKGGSVDYYYDGSLLGAHTEHPADIIGGWEEHESTDAEVDSEAEKNYVEAYTALNNKTCTPSDLDMTIAKERYKSFIRGLETAAELLGEQE